MNGGTNFKNYDRTHPRQQLHDHMTSIYIVYVEQRVAATIHDDVLKLIVLIKL